MSNIPSGKGRGVPKTAKTDTPSKRSGVAVSNLKIVLVLTTFLAATFAMGSIANRRSEQNARRTSEPASVLPNSTPQYHPASPAVEYVHAGGKLIAVSQPTQPVPADLAVWRPSTGTWWVMGGQGSQQVTQGWGMNGDEPVPGDYDGDGKTDFSIFRPSTGEWYVLQSSDNAWMPVMAWGAATDKRVAADFDADGKTDRAVWRPRPVPLPINLTARAEIYRRPQTTTATDERISPCGETPIKLSTRSTARTAHRQASASTNQAASRSARTTTAMAAPTTQFVAVRTG